MLISMIKNQLLITIFVTYIFIVNLVLKINFIKL